MPNPSQEPTASSKVPIQDLEDFDVLCTYKMMIYSQISEYECIKEQWLYLIKIKMPYPSQEHPATTKALNQYLKDMGVLCTFKMKIEIQNLDHGCIKDHWPYPIKDQDVDQNSGTSSVLQRPISGLEEQESSLHLQYQHREPQFRS